MSENIDTGKKLKLIETDDIHKVPFEAGQYIIVDNGQVYYDSTTGSSLDDRICINPKQEVDIYERTNNKSDEYYLALHVKPMIGDIVIIKDLIPNSSNYSHTIYIYNNNDEDTNDADWCKSTGSYNDKDIYFNEDINITVPFEQLFKEPKVINASGKNVEEVINSIFSPELNPKITQPSVELTFPSGSYEVGTKITPAFSMKLNPGKYEYGPDTDVTATEYLATSSNDETINAKSGNFPEIIVTESMNYYISAIITHSAGSIPLTNKDNPYSAGQIVASSVSMNSNPIKGYVNGLFYGTVETDISSGITSEIVRSLNKSGKAYKAENVNLTVPVGAKSIKIACPKGKTGVTKIYNNTVNADMTQAFGNSIEVKVNGNSDSDEYAKIFNVWSYTPAEAYGVTASLTITLS